MNRYDDWIGRLIDTMALLCLAAFFIYMVLSVIDEVLERFAQ